MPGTTSQVRRTAKSLFRWCLKDGELDERRAREAIKHIMQTKRRGYFALLNEFKRLVKFERARRIAKVESAFPLESELLVRLRRNLERVYGAGVSTEFAHNPELIAGMRIRVASDVYDSSVKSKLAALATRFGIMSY